MPEAYDLICEAGDMLADMVGMLLTGEACDLIRTCGFAGGSGVWCAANGWRDRLFGVSA